MLGPLARDRHARLGHDLHRPHVHPVRLDTGRIRFDLLSLELARPSLGHLAAAGIPGAQEQNFQSSIPVTHCAISISGGTAAGASGLTPAELFGVLAADGLQSLAVLAHFLFMT